MQESTGLKLFLLLCVSTAATAQVFFFGPCPDFPVTRRFKPERFAGKWYESEKYFSMFEDLYGGRCPSITFTDRGNGRMEIHNSVASSSGFTTSKVTSGDARQLNPASTEAKFRVKYQGNPFIVDGTQWVLETDYTKYAILWSCQDFSLFTLQYLWILTRERKPNKEVIERAREDMDILGLSTEHLRSTNQDNCLE